MKQWFRFDVFAGRMIAIGLLLLSLGQPALATSLPGQSQSTTQPLITQLIVKFKAPAAGIAVSAADFAMTPSRLQTLTAAAGVPVNYKRAMAGNCRL